MEVKRNDWVQLKKAFKLSINLTSAFAAAL